MNNLINNRLIRNASGLNWFEAKVGLEGTIGIVLMIGAVLFILNRESSLFKFQRQCRCDDWIGESSHFLF